MKPVKYLLAVGLFSLIILPPFVVSAETVDITALVQGCGDGIIEGGEQCDGSDFGGETCVSQGFRRGGLTCTAGCTIDTVSCSNSSGSNNVPPGGGGANIPESNVVFSGTAYPLSKVTVLKDGQIVATTIAEPTGNFSTTISGVSTGHYQFTVFAEDKNGSRSSALAFRTFVNSEVTTKITGIFLSPSISFGAFDNIDSTTVARGTQINIFGQSEAGSLVKVRLDNAATFLTTASAKDNGDYQAALSSNALALGTHTLATQSVLGDKTSPFSPTVSFTVSAAVPVSPPTPPSGSATPGDINGDGRINLADYSILAYWYKRPLSNNFRKIEKQYFNGDGVVDMTDLSILAYYWTG